MVFGEGPCGDGCEVQGEGRGWGIVCPAIGARLLLGGNCTPALIPLVQPGKGRERSGFTAFCLIDFELGKPGGAGKDNICRHRSTLVLWIARPWTGLV